MGKILQQLYRGDLCPAENTIRGNAEYDALTRQSMDDFNRFTDKLDRDMKEEFDLLMEHYPVSYTHLDVYKRQPWDRWWPI